MIYLIDDMTTEDTDLLKQSWRGKRIYSYYRAYGTKFDFCRFYRFEDESARGVLWLMNSSLEGCFEGDFDVTELAVFIMHHMPFRVQLTENAINGLLEYAEDHEDFDAMYGKLRRTCFEIDSKTVKEKIGDKFCEDEVEFNPKLDDVYKILSAGFPNIIDYGLWLTDTSHRCRHGVSHVLTYKNATTASIMFDIDDDVLVGQVATLPESRGCGYARDFLAWLGDFLANFGKRAVLYALDIRVSFYREIGFKELFCEYVLEYKDTDKDNMSKGELV